MIHPALRISVLLFAVLACGCVSTRVRGEKLVADAPAYRRVVVFCDVEDEGVRDQVEQAVAKELDEEEGIQAAASLDILVEAKVYTPEEVRAALRSGAWEAMLIVGLDEYVTEVFTHPGSFGFAGSPFGGAVFLEPPTQFDRSTLQIYLQVVDNERDKPVWNGEAIASSSHVHSLEGLVREIADRTRGRLADDGILVPRPRR